MEVIYGRQKLGALLLELLFALFGLVRQDRLGVHQLGLLRAHLLLSLFLFPKLFELLPSSVKRGAFLTARSRGSSNDFLVHGHSLASTLFQAGHQCNVFVLRSEVKRNNRQLSV